MLKFPEKPGDCHMIIDMGGGTVDIVCHEVMSDYQVKELISPSGGAWGSTIIDKEFELILKDMVGEKLLANFRARYPVEYMQLLSNFEASKIAFFKSAKYQKMKLEELYDKRHNVAVPSEFTDFMEEHLPDWQQKFQSFTLNDLAQ
ncbi:hypothetical protein RFI_33253 [Reticulomyxa filosa]|nr:hypothetical protein RFI_33253 [Reticulomyxa filosa]|eukprot:ETO04149.1 hypothetical protein RFI_33253 [Reticulomyxa filosa]